MPQPTSKMNLLFVISLAWQFGFMIIAPIIGMVFLGNWLDNKYNLSPIFLIIGLLLGLTISIYQAYKALLPFIKPQ